MKKTTIAIVPDSREKLGKIKRVLQEVEPRHFVDMDEVVLYLLDQVPKKMREKIEGLNNG